MQTFEKNTGITNRKIDNELFLYDRKENLIHSFNETGTFLWEHCSETGATPESLATLLAETFEVTQSIASRDVLDFLDECIGLKLLIPHA